MRKIRFADRMKNIPFSPSLAIIKRIRALRQEGVEIINFGTREDTPTHAKSAAMQHLQKEAASAYTDTRGTPELREAIAYKLKAENGLIVDPDTEIVAAVGGKQGVLSALLTLVEKGDEVLLEDPGWLSFEPMVRMVGAKPIPIPILEENGFKLNVDDLRKKITPKSRVLILCDPHNPTGRMLDRADLEGIAEVVRQHDLIVIMDEAYESFTYDGRKHVSMASLEGMWERTISIQSASKIYNMYGWRVGWVAANKQFSEKIQAINSHSITCPTSFAQAGVAEALRNPMGFGDISIKQLIKNHQLQRDTLVTGLRSIPGVTCELPMGTFFAFPNFKKFNMNSEELSTYLLENAGVATWAGSFFGDHGEGHLRLVFNSPVPEIEVGLEKMAKSLNEL
jgi:aminotransferase